MGYGRSVVIGIDPFSGRCARISMCLMTDRCVIKLGDKYLGWHCKDRIGLVKTSLCRFGYPVYVGWFKFFHYDFIDIIEACEFWEAFTNACGQKSEWLQEGF